MALAPDAVDKLRRRTETNMKKVGPTATTNQDWILIAVPLKLQLQALRDTPSPTPATSADFDKLTSSIEADQRQIDLLLRRRTFIRWCMWQETVWLFRCTSSFKTLLRDLVAGEREFAKAVERVWEDLDERLGA